MESAYPIHCLPFLKPALIASHLDVEHFKALGVKNAKDCRKLFYLVQHIKIGAQ